ACRPYDPSPRHGDPRSFPTRRSSDLEDPIEYVHRHEGCIITQRELGIDTDSWDAALKNTLRQAPDVILIGEVRTRETMEYAINRSEEHTSELQSRFDLVCRLLLEKKQ